MNLRFDFVFTSCANLLLHSNSLLVEPRAQSWHPLQGRNDIRSCDFRYSAGH